MVMILKPEATRRDIDYVIRRAANLGLRTHVSEQNGQTFIGLLGDLGDLDISALAGLPGVEQVRSMKRPFHLASRDLRPESTTVNVYGAVVGGERLAMMAGPCSVETLDRVLETARAAKDAGAQFLRGGAFKPRSSPYSFRGLAQEGLEILAEARRETGLAVVTEVLAPEQIPLVARYADVFQIGARNMQNYMLLDAVGETGMPVLLKRGMSSTIEEFLLSAEYILSHGNPNVILCERGIRTFETSTRNSLDINAIPVLKELTHLPVLVDPSHATGKASLVAAVSRAAIAAGADGLLIEVHHDPESAWSDGFQTLSAREFTDLMTGLEPIARAVGRST
jgi:3-deoxy-7-phosphoheptulonate synthase